MPEIKRYCGGHTTMLLKKLKDFHERTMEQYKEEENLEPWKKKVMELHEKSAFLFYYDATLEENAEQNSLIIQGSLVEGELPIGSTVYLYTGEGKYLGSGRILSEPEEKEQGRRGLFKRRRNQFNLGLDAVSYTHLDVYKRQRHGSRFCRTFCYRSTDYKVE